jgi:DNA-binding transcriptional LysR family regulator
MEYDQVRYFVALCRALNFTRAAEASKVSQPALTRAIQKLEEELGGQLIYRERGLTRLTEFGQTIRPHLEAMLDAAEAARQAARCRAGTEPSPLRIGLGRDVAVVHVADAIRSLVNLYPQLSVHFEESGTAALTEAMLSGMLDCALLTDDGPIPSRLHRWEIAREGCVVAMPASHRLGNRENVTIADLEGETLLSGEQCGGFTHRLRATCGDAFIERSCGGTWAQILDLVRAGLGLALLPDGILATGKLLARPLSEPQLERTVLLTIVAGRPHRPAVANFVKLCRARAGAGHRPALNSTRLAGPGSQ